MARTDRMNYFILLICQLCSILITEAFHETINVKIKNGDEIIELNWKRTGEYFANQNLPIWLAGKNAAPRLLPQALSKLGQFICYHDLEKSSAVVFFPSIGKFYGIIDTRFYIARLPLNLKTDIYYEVGGNYIIPVRDDDYSHDGGNNLFGELFSGDQLAYINSLIAKNIGELLPKPSLKRLHPEEPNGNIPSTSTGDGALNQIQSMPEKLKTSQPITLYPEILVFITNDIFHVFRLPNLEKGIIMLLLYYITYFNAIDMLFAKLATNDVTIHINIAGFVIESKPNSFQYDLWTDEKQNTASGLCFHEHEILHSFSRYINKHKNVLVEDSFDFFFVSTGRRIGFGPKTIQGKSTPLMDMYMQRMKQESNTNYLGSVVHRKTSILDYVVATRELATLMGIKYDLTSEGQFETGKRCHSIMQKTNTHCRNCLHWTEQNKRDLQIYFRWNRNRCFLLNFPRSLFPYGQPVASLNPEVQCLCYKYSRETLNPFYMLSVPADSCDKQMQCSYVENLHTLSPLPIDGTPCGFSNKVCWRKQCVEVNQSHRVDNSNKICHGKTKKMRTNVRTGSSEESMKK